MTISLQVFLIIFIHINFILYSAIPTRTDNPVLHINYRIGTGSKFRHIPTSDSISTDVCSTTKTYASHLYFNECVSFFMSSRK